MADISVEPGQGGRHTWIWAIVALLSIAALMIWLAMQEGTTSPAEVVGADTAVVESPAADTVPAAAAGDTVGAAPAQ